MIQTYRSPPADPHGRGLSFGRAHAERIRATADRYADLFELAGVGPRSVAGLGARILDGIRSWHPAAAAEIEGIAAGSGLPVATVAALNARTEVLAAGERTMGSECSTFVSLDPASGGFAAQTWDWHEELAESWLVWTVELPDGRSFHTLTEYGVLGKIGINSAGVAVLFNILHHEADGPGDGATPVHVVARRVLAEARDVEEAVALATAAAVTASTSLTVAGGGDRPAVRCVELWPGGPGAVEPPGDGAFVRTNHFLSPDASGGDREAVLGPDSFGRFEVLSARLQGHAPASVADCFDVLCSHDRDGAVCVHPERDAPFGERYATLATVAIDIGKASMTVRAGGPCEENGDRRFATRS